MSSNTNRFRYIPRHGGFPSHHFVGGSRLIRQLLPVEGALPVLAVGPEPKLCDFSFLILFDAVHWDVYSV